MTKITPILVIANSTAKDIDCPRLEETFMSLFPKININKIIN